MIQLTALNGKGMNNAIKPSEKGMEKSAAFVDLLKQISGKAEEKKEVDGLVNANPFFIIVPFRQSPMETAPATVDEAGVKKQNTPENLSSVAALHPNGEAFIVEYSEPRIVKQIEPMIVSASPESVPSFSDHSTSVPAILEDGQLGAIQGKHSSLQENIQEQTQQTVSFDEALLSMLDGKEHPQIQVIQPANTGPSLNPSTQINDPSGRIVSEMPVRAEHLAKDVTKFIADAIDVHKLNDKIEASFSLKPEHLGKVDVKVSIHDGNVTAEFFTNTTLGKDLLETQVQVLRTALEQHGFQVDKIDISQQNMNFAGPFSQKGDSHGRQGQQESKKRNGAAVYNQEEEYWDFAVESISASQINTTA